MIRPSYPASSCQHLLPLTPGLQIMAPKMEGLSLKIKDKFQQHEIWLPLVTLLLVGSSRGCKRVTEKVYKYGSHNVFAICRCLVIQARYAFKTYWCFIRGMSVHLYLSYVSGPCMWAPEQDIIRLSWCVLIKRHGNSSKPVVEALSGR